VIGSGAPDPDIHRLAIVGGGPRATYAMERLSAEIGRLDPDRRLEVRIFERSGEFGAGAVHSPAQPTSSYLNRIASQVSFAADETVKGAGPLRLPGQRPTLHEWCRRRFAETGHPDLDLGPRDWPRRYIHGLALREMFDSYLDDLRAHPGVTVHLHHDEVVAIERRGADLRVRIAGSAGLPTDQVLLVTGHTDHEPRRSARTRALLDFAERRDCVYVPHAYPLDATLPLEITGPDRVVGLDGMGLTAIDEILYLTEGRGGTFEPDPDYGLRYRPSGAEPLAILAFSETGLFTFARPDNHKDADPALEHRGVFLTTGAVDRLRAAVGDRHGQLDFDRDVLPLIVLEMAFLHYVTLLGPSTAEFLTDRLAPTYQAFVAGGAPHRERIDEPDRLLEPLENAVDKIVAGLPGSAPAGDRFSWERTFAPLGLPGRSGPEEYRDAVLAFMERDQQWAHEGNLANPHKAAADGVWRDLRPVICHAVDDGGLSPRSHRRFLARYVRLHNRLANGAAPQVMARIQAVIRHGLLHVGAGPGATVRPDPTSGRFRVDGPATGVSFQVDTLVDARVHPFDPRRDASPLFRNLAAEGIVRLWRNVSADGEVFEPGGLDLSDSFHPVGANERVEDRITILGPAVEGRRSFLFSALRPNSDHYVMHDTLTWLREFWRLLEQPRARSEDAV
jgi:FAD-NAD(P)-binding protein